MVFSIYNLTRYLCMFHVAVQFTQTFMEWNVDLGSRSLRPLNSYRQTSCYRQTFQILILNDYFSNCNSEHMVMLLLLFFATSNLSKVEVVSATIPSYLQKHKNFLSCPPKKLKLSGTAYLTDGSILWVQPRSYLRTTQKPCINHSRISSKQSCHISISPCCYVLSCHKHWSNGQSIRQNWDK